MTITEENPDQKPNTSSGSGNIFSAKLNVTAILLTAAIIFSAIKLSALLPQSYYFTLTSLIGGERSSPFIINTPILLSNEEICKRARAKGVEIERLCWDDEDLEKPNKSGASNRSSSNETRTEQKADSSSQTSAQTLPSSPSPPQKVESDPKDKLLRELQERLELDRKERKESAAVREIQSQAPKSKSIIALLLRCMIPFFAGVIVARFYRSEMLAETGFGAALSVVALFWPVAYLWHDLQIAEEWNDKQNLFLVLYFCYAALFCYLARLGAQLGHTYFSRRAGANVSLDKRKMVESFIPSLIAGIVVQLIVFFVLLK